MTVKRWIIKGGKVLGPAPFLLMGILNLSPESFSDSARGIKRHSGKELPPPVSEKNNPPPPPINDGFENLKSSARNMVLSGAAVLDLGGEYTRPGAAALPVGEEIARVLPALAALREEFSKEESSPALSVDTYKAETARAALAAGAEIINDISAWSFEPELKDVILEHKPGYVLMHCRGRPADMQQKPRYHNVVDEVFAFFEQKLDELARGAFPEEHILLDPGIGFGKTLEHNLALLQNIERFYALGRPLLLGLSYKSFLGEITGALLGERCLASATASALLAARGVWAHRVHDVRETKQALELARAISKK